MVDNLHSEYYYGGWIRGSTTYRRNIVMLKKTTVAFIFLSLLFFSPTFMYLILSKYGPKYCTLQATLFYNHFTIRFK